MLARISPRALKGEIFAIPSKAAAHRIFISAALSDKPIIVKCSKLSKDIYATIGCLNALGASIKPISDGDFLVEPIKNVSQNVVLDCGESGTSLRFILPIVSALGANACIIRRGRLASRPISELSLELVRMGAEIREEGEKIFVSGRIKAGDYRIKGDISSQYVSGLLLALPILANESRLFIEGNLESRPYVELTKSVQEKFGINYELGKEFIHIKNNTYKTILDEITVEGDWSNSAFWLCAGALRGEITVRGLDINSAQGDKKVLEILEKMGAKISVNDEYIKISHGKLKAVDIDARDIPDLIPILSVVLAVSDGKSEIYSAQRLRLKESDRIYSVCAMLENLSAIVSEKSDGFSIEGIQTLSGGRVNSFNDHRIVMAAAVASVVSDAEIIIEDAGAVSKSYPSFFDDFRSLGGSIILSGE